jgi:hypothetical protein
MWKQAMKGNQLNDEHTFNWNRPEHDQQHCYHHAPTVKPEAATADVVAPDDGHGDARNMLSCN